MAFWSTLDKNDNKWHSRVKNPATNETVEEIEEEDSLSKKDLAELIRSIVRDEMNRNANNNNQYPNSWRQLSMRSKFAIRHLMRLLRTYLWHSIS